MSKQRYILIVLGLFLAVGSAYGLLSYSGQLEPKVPVVVVKKDMEPLERFSAENVQIILVPPGYVLPQAVTTLEQLAGKMAGAPLYRGEQVLSGRVGQDLISAGKNERYLYIKNKNVLMKPGQKIDVYLVYEPGKLQYAGVERVLSGKRVVNVLDETGKGLYSNGNKPDPVRSQAGLEILVTQEEIADYLDRLRYAAEVLVRYGERSD